MKHGYESFEAAIQHLTFEKMNCFFQHKTNRNVITPDTRTQSGSFNNYAYLISDQCPWHIIMDTPDSRMEFSGPLPVQVIECLTAIRRWNPNVRLDCRVGNVCRFPTVAIKEALVNSIIHFDPSLMRDIHIDIDSDMISIRSPGPMVEKGPYDEILGVVRNPRLAHLMMCLGYATLKGKGTSTLRMCYGGSGVIPRITSNDNEFLVHIPSIQYKREASDKRTFDVHSYIYRKPGCSISELSSETMISPYELKKIIDDLESRGHVFMLGKGSKRMVFLTNPNNRNLEMIAS